MIAATRACAMQAKKKQQFTTVLLLEQSANSRPHPSAPAGCRPWPSCQQQATPDVQLLPV
jgi:hypothetical protein